LALPLPLALSLPFSFSLSLSLALPLLPLSSCLRLLLILLCVSSHILCLCREALKEAWNDNDEAKFKDWKYLSDPLFYKEVVENLKWAEENGDLRFKKKSSACTVQ
jgi:hypothetical protein